MKRRFPFTTLYLLLLAAVVIASWLVGLYGVESGGNLLSDEGGRWWMRSVLPSFAASPVGEILVVLFTLGIVKSVWLESPRVKSKKATAVALMVFVALMGLLLWGVFSGALMSVTGHWANSPLQRGWLVVLALLIGIPSLCYGLTNGTFTNREQVLGALCSEVVRCAPSFVTLFIASQLIAVLAYSGLPAVCGIGAAAFHGIAAVIYWLPFVFEYFYKNRI